MITHLFSEATRKQYEEATGGGPADQPRPTIVAGDEEFIVDLSGLGDPEQRFGASIAEAVQDTEDELRQFLALHHFLDDNPRVKKHVVNVHRLVKILLQEPGAAWPVERQRQLVSWLIFCHRWRWLAKELLEQAATYARQPDTLDVWRSAHQGELADRELEEFIEVVETPFPGDELGDDGFLRQAMIISRMATAGTHGEDTEKESWRSAIALAGSLC